MGWEKEENRCPELSDASQPLQEYVARREKVAIALHRLKLFPNLSSQIPDNPF